MTNLLGTIKKFRAWHIGVGKWLTNPIIEVYKQLNANGDDEVRFFVISRHKRYCDEDIEIDHSTGMIDKNGTEIFICDIVEYKKKYKISGERLFIIWDTIKQGSLFDYVKYRTDEVFNLINNDPDFLAQCVVIGNGAENPELKGM